MRPLVPAVLLLTSLSLGQTGKPALTFEVADVHPSANSVNPTMRGGSTRSGRYEIRTATMVDLIRTAYGVDEDKVLGGPAWLETDRFDILAKAPVSSEPDAIAIMLRALLADRFKLVLHDATRPGQAYALTQDKKVQMKAWAGAADGTAESQCGYVQGVNTPGEIAPVRFSCRKITMPEFAKSLSTAAPNYITHPVLDQTGIQGEWDLDLVWTARGGDNVVRVTPFDAIQKQIGLKLTLQDVPVPVLVVDSVQEKPTDNLPGVSKSLPPMPTSFEVADVKLSDPVAPVRNGGGFLPGGRFDWRGASLQNLIQAAWDLRPDTLAGAPKWLDTTRFDIVAKAPVTGPATNIDTDSLRIMLRGLLLERFKLTTHFEDQPVPTLVLTSSRNSSRRVKADPANRTSCKKTPGAGGAKFGNGTNPVFTYVCHNMTVAQFADKLPTLSEGELDRAVIDSSGIAGAWDFIVSWTPVWGFRNRGGDTTQAAEPTGFISLSEALDKQLGLKLETQKRPAPVLVIDHVEPTPTEN